MVRINYWGLCTRRKGKKELIVDLVRVGQIHTLFMPADKERRVFGNGYEDNGGSRTSSRDKQEQHWERASIKKERST